MDWIKSILVGRRTYLMVIVAAALHYLLTLGIVVDPFLIDTITHARDLAFLAIPIFMRLGIKAMIR